MAASNKEMTITLSDLPDFGSPRPHVLTELIIEKLRHNLSRFRRTALMFTDANVFDIVATQSIEHVRRYLKHEGIKVVSRVDRANKIVYFRRHILAL